jgi:NifU-like protein involved in Fe-S cluster formation
LPRRAPPLVQQLRVDKREFGGEKTSRKLADEERKLLVESGYTKKAIELYVNNVNVGGLENPSIVTTYLGLCGDLIKLYLEIDSKGIIRDSKFYYLGCPGSASSTSALTELLKGKSVGQAKKITEDDILKMLGGLPEAKLDCPKLSIKTLRKAIAEYEKLQGLLEM